MEYYTVISSNTQDVHIATWTNLRKVREVGKSKIYRPRPFVQMKFVHALNSTILDVNMHNKGHISRGHL